MKKQFNSHEQWTNGQRINAFQDNKVHELQLSFGVFFAPQRKLDQTLLLVGEINYPLAVRPFLRPFLRRFVLQ
jgi:hypothetical protein